MSVSVARLGVFNTEVVIFFNLLFCFPCSENKKRVSLTLTFGSLMMNFLEPFYNLLETLSPG